MSALLIRLLAMTILLIAIFGPVARLMQAQEEKAAVFPVKYISNDSVYLGAGRNAGIQEGMKVSVVNSTSYTAADNGVRFRGEAHVAELRVVSVADSSAVCEIVSTKGELSLGQLAFLTPDSIVQRRQEEFVDNLCRKLLAFALGRTLLPGDDDLVLDMRHKLAANDYRLGTLVEAIITSPQFLNRRTSG